MPSTLKQVVNRIKASKNAIADAIVAKGGTVTSDDGLEEFAVDIATIPSWEVDGTPIIYGWHVNPDIADSSNAVAYLEDAVG